MVVRSQTQPEGVSRLWRTLTGSSFSPCESKVSRTSAATSRGEASDSNDGEAKAGNGAVDESAPRASLWARVPAGYVGAITALAVFLAFEDFFSLVLRRVVRDTACAAAMLLANALALAIFATDALLGWQAECGAMGVKRVSGAATVLDGVAVAVPALVLTITYIASVALPADGQAEGPSALPLLLSKLRPLALLKPMVTQYRFRVVKDALEHSSKPERLRVRVAARVRQGALVISALALFLATVADWATLSRTPGALLSRAFHEATTPTQQALAYTQGMVMTALGCNGEGECVVDDVAGSWLQPSGYEAGQNAWRKLVLVFSVGVWAVTAVWAAEALVLGPVKSTVNTLGSLAAQLDDRGMVKPKAEPDVADDSRRVKKYRRSDSGGVDTIDQAMKRVQGTVQLVVKASQRGQVVLERVMREAAQDSVTGLGLGEWTHMYQGVLATAPSVGDDAGEDVPGSEGHSMRQSQTGCGVEMSHSSRALGGFGSSGNLVGLERQGASPGSLKWSSLHLDNDALEAAVMTMFVRLRIVDARDPSMPTKTMVRALVGHLAARYDPSNPYHNWRHAVEVAHACFVMLQDSHKHARGRPWARREKLCLMVAALGHDVGHTGVSNDFLIKTSHPLAITYSDDSPHERAHCATLFRVMIDDPSANVFANMSPDDQAAARRAIISLIHSTDMQQHFEITGELESLAEQLEQEGILGAIPAEPSRRLLLLQGMLKAADIGHIVREPLTMFAWSCRVVSEFFTQGDMERELKIPGCPCKMMDRHTEYVPQGQLGFIDALARPFFCALCTAAPWHPWMLNGLVESYQHWLAIIRDHQSMVLPQLAVSQGLSNSEARAAVAANETGAAGDVSLANPKSMGATSDISMPIPLRAAAERHSVHSPDFTRACEWELATAPRPEADELLPAVNALGAIKQQRSRGAPRTDGASPSTGSAVATNDFRDALSSVNVDSIGGGRKPSSSSRSRRSSRLSRHSATSRKSRRRSRLGRTKARNSAPGWTTSGDDTSDGGEAEDTVGAVLDVVRPRHTEPGPSTSAHATGSDRDEASLRSQALVYLPTAHLPRAALVMDTEQQMRTFQERVGPYIQRVKVAGSLLKSTRRAGSGHGGLSDVPRRAAVRVVAWADQLEQ
ncbi:unnamed protein product [Pedinophyceae sp. YPF-701]|nr:unnamed protein product [Pedinophyceae sp. YPF-701]